GSGSSTSCNTSGPPVRVIWIAFTGHSDVFRDRRWLAVAEFRFGRQGAPFARQDAVLANLKRDFLAVLQTLVSILLLAHPRPNHQTAREFQLDPQHHSQKKGPPQGCMIAVLRKLARDLDGVRPEANPQFLSLRLAVGGEFQFANACDAVPHLRLQHV